MTRKTRYGSCHCGAVAFEADINLAEDGTRRCNCSICTKARAWFTVVSPDHFRLTRGEEMLSDYSWTPPGGTKMDMHYLFCGNCGVRIAGRGALESLGGTFYAVAVAALDDVWDDADALAASITYADGRHDDYEQPPADTRLL